MPRQPRVQPQPAPVEPEQSTPSPAPAPVSETPVLDAAEEAVAQEGGETAGLTEDPNTYTPSGNYGEVYERQQGLNEDLSLTLSDTQQGAMDSFTENWDENRARYEAVAEQAGMPPELIAALHWRESSGNFDTYLHQGDPLGAPAVHWPNDIPVFDEWEEAAIHALESKASVRDDIGITAETTDAAALGTFAEAYNGLGYHYRDQPSPYVYAGTSAYESGKFVADGVYDPDHVDQQLGVMAMMDAIGGLDVDVADQQ